MSYFSLSFNSGPRFRDWSRSIYALSRINDHLTINVSSSKVTLSALNAPMSAYASVDFNADDFFERFHFFDNDAVAEDDALRFSSVNARSSREINIEVMTKFFVSIFRRHEKDAALEKCEISLDYSDARSSQNESRLIIVLHCHFGVVKTYKLAYAKKSRLRVLDTVDDYPNSFQVKSSLLREYLEHTSARAEVFSIRFDNREIALASFTDAVIRNQEILKQPLSTSIVVDRDDFDSTIVDDDSEAILSLKEFKVLVNLADSFGAVIEGSFSEPMLPIAFQFGGEYITVRFLLFTGDSQAGTARASSTALNLARRKLVMKVGSPDRDLPVAKAARTNTAEQIRPPARQQVRQKTLVDGSFRYSSADQLPVRSLAGSVAGSEHMQSRQDQTDVSQQRVEAGPVTTVPESMTGTPLPPPILPNLTFISPYGQVNNVAQEDDDEAMHSDGSDVVVWNQVAAAPSLERMMQEAQGSGQVPEQDTNEYPQDGTPDGMEDEEGLFAQDVYTRTVISPTQKTKVKEIFDL